MDIKVTGPPLAEKIAIIGAGKVGRALTKGLQAAGVSVGALLDLHPERAQECAESCDPNPVYGMVTNLPAAMTLVIVCVPDDHITTVASALAATRKIDSDCVIAHTSGALSPEALEPLRSCSELLASFHPLQTFAGQADDWRRLQGTFFGADGPKPALQRLEKIARALNGHLVRIPEDARTLYHLACVLASNFLVTLVSTAVDVLQRIDFPRTEAIAMLGPLLNTTVANIIQLGAGEALTGPMVRGDTGTVARHCQIIMQDLPEIAELYLALGRKTLELARQMGQLTDNNVVKMENTLIDLEGNITR